MDLKNICEDAMISTRHFSPKRSKAELTFLLKGQRMKTLFLYSASLWSSNSFNGNKGKKLNTP